MDATAKTETATEQLLPEERRDPLLNVCIGNYRVVKLLGEGELGTALKVHLHGVSETARQKIEAAGGSIEIIAKPEASAD